MTSSQICIRFLLMLGFPFRKADDSPKEVRVLEFKALRKARRELARRGLNARDLLPDR